MSERVEDAEHRGGEAVEASARPAGGGGESPQPQTSGRTQRMSPDSAATW